MKITVQYHEATQTIEVAVVNEESGETLKSATLEHDHVGSIALGSPTTTPEIAVEAADGSVPEPEGGEPAADPRTTDAATGEAPADAEPEPTPEPEGGEASEGTEGDAPEPTAAGDTPEPESTPATGEAAAGTESGMTEPPAGGGA